MTKKYPAPLYAAAGAGDYAYRQLRKLPARFNELRDKLATSDLDVDRLRKSARRNAAAALDEARTVYATLVARGERVVDGRPQRAGGARKPLAVRQPADVAPAEVAPAEAPAEASAEVAPAKPVKRTRTAVTK